MIKHSTKQTGSTHITIISLIVLVIIGVLGLVYWNNFVNKHQATSKNAPSSQETEKSVQKEMPNSQLYTLSDAVEGINSTLAKDACSGKASVKQEDFIKVKDTDPFNYQGGKSLIDEQFNFTYVQYGCGSQGFVTLMKRIDGDWKIVSEDARIYPMCDVVRNENFPLSIVDKCYKTNRSTEPTDIQ